MKQLHFFIAAKPARGGNVRMNSTPATRRWSLHPRGVITKKRGKNNLGNLAMASTHTLSLQGASGRVVCQR